MRKSVLGVFALAGVLAVAPAVFAQDACQLDGTANIPDGLYGDGTISEGVDFEFSGDLSSCLNSSSGTACAIGTVTGACPGNTHEGEYVICSGECANHDPITGELLEEPICNGDVISDGHLDGVCAGANCTGGDIASLGNIYTLLFTAETIQDALEQCPGDGLRATSFTGAIGWQ